MRKLPPPRQDISHIRLSRLEDTIKTAKRLRLANISGEETLHEFFLTISFTLSLQNVQVSRR
ncbi:MAG: hypothetical protein ACTSVM_01510 [Candidatus Ranarchaeia archaeon]